MPYVVTTDSYPGYWGSGETEKQAKANCTWGRAPFISYRIHDAYTDPQIDQMGRLWATPGPLIEHLAREDRPPVVVEAWRLSGNGSRKPVDPSTGQPLT